MQKKGYITERDLAKLLGQAVCVHRNLYDMQIWLRDGSCMVVTAKRDCTLHIDYYDPETANRILS